MSQHFTQDQHPDGHKNWNCPDCGAEPGKPHSEGCDIEICSVCGTQKLSCSCNGHDRLFARWTGFWPGAAEAAMCGRDLNWLYTNGMYKALFIKPKG